MALRRQRNKIMSKNKIAIITGAILSLALVISLTYIGCGGASSDSGSSAPAFPGYSGNLNQAGGAIYNGGHLDWGVDIAVDSVITDGPFVYTLGATFASDTDDGSTVLAKFNSAGDIIASARFNGIGGMAMALSQTAIYITGQRPTPSAYVTAKYDLNLNLITSTALAGDASARAITLDNSGNVYVIGSEIHTPAVAGNDYDYKIVKYNANLVQQGNPITYDSGVTDEGSGIAADNSGNIYVTGAKISGTDYSFTTLKYNSSLVLQNTDEYTTSVYVNTNNSLYPKIAVDKNSGNVYVFGTAVGSAGPGNPYRDFLLIKYNSSLSPVNAVTYANGLEGVSLTIDSSGNIYVFGNYFNGTVQDAWMVVKYNSALAVQSFITDKAGTNSADEPGGIALDNTGRVYLIGLTSPDVTPAMSSFNLRAKRFPAMTP